MRIVRSLATVCFVLGVAAGAAAQVSCDDVDELCTGNPCETSNLAVDSSCTIDFGDRALVIGGKLDVPPGGVLSFTASSITVQGRIDAPGAAVTLVADVGPADLDTEIDVGTGSLVVSAVENVDVKNRLKAKPGGSVTVTAGELLETGPSGVIETQDGGSVTLSGDLGVTIAGRIFVGDGLPGTVQITSSAGTVTLNQDINARGVPSTVTVAGATGVVVNENIAANNGDPGGTVTLTSSGGDVEVRGNVSVRGENAGAIIVQAPLGTAGPFRFDAKGKFNGGSITVEAATVAADGKIAAKGSNGDGGSIELTASTLLTLGLSLSATGKVNGGQIALRADPSGDIVVDGGGMAVSGGHGNGGSVVVSAPAGSVSLRTKINATAKSGLGGTILVDGVALTIGPKSRFDADTHGTGGEVRFAQSGPGLLLLDASCEARVDGVIEALAPAGSLTARGKFRTGAGCVGFSASVAPDLSAADADVAVTPSCP